MNAIQLNMNRITTLFSICLSVLTSGCEDIDVMLAANAGMDEIKAVTLSDEEALLCRLPMQDKLCARVYLLSIMRPAVSPALSSAVLQNTRIEYLST